MATTQLSITEEQTAGIPTQETSAAEDVRRGFWGTLRWRAQVVLWNYMCLQGQLGLYGSSDDFGDQ
ncbi:hypothetical protein FIM08_00290 [SAR202 cluster bacterium AC-647-N09_OGT_505m]|nr:hypothetical protein [SAR202 cluster bacterium AC-647-N09_OGT_505m]